MRPLMDLQALAVILAVAAGAILTRFLPFWLFPDHRRVPRVVLYLGQALPPAMMGLLLVYCLKDVNFAAAPHAVPEAAALLVVFILHRWKRHALLSIGGGTAAYLLLLRLLSVA